MKRWYMVAIDSADRRPTAQRRLGLEVARALHGHFGAVEVWSVGERQLAALEGVNDGKAINYDPSSIVEDQLADVLPAAEFRAGTHRDA